MNRNKLVLFDLGGVVIDIDFARIWQSWTERSGVTLGKLAQELGPHSTSNEAFHRFERGEISEEAFYLATAARTGIQMSVEDWRAGWNAIFIGEIPGTLDLLQLLKGKVPLMALSNINAPHHRVTTTRFASLLTPFDQIFFSHELGLRKPESAIFDVVARESGVAHRNILFFDDMMSNVEGARQAGLQAEVFVSAARAKSQISSFLELPL